MTQPRFVPIAEADQVRPSSSLHVPGAWYADRPAELAVPRRVIGRRRGTPGPDQGFALRLVKRFADRLVLVPGESPHDVEVGCALVASARAGLFGRAPSVYDLEMALELWGYLGPAPSGLVAARGAAFAGVAHDYGLQRALVDGVPVATLRLSADDVAARRDDWSSLLATGPVTADPGPPAGH
jgi:hypothetical protein